MVPALGATRNGRSPAARSSTHDAPQRRRDPCAARRRSARCGAFRREKPGDRGGLRDARVRLLAHVVRAVEEVLAELRVTRRDHRGQVRHRPARRAAVPASPSGKPNIVAEPAGDVLLDLHDRGARRPQTHEPVHPLREELGQRRGVQTRRPGCRRGSRAPRTRTCFSMAPAASSNSGVEVAADLRGGAARELAGELDRALGVASAGASSSPPMKPQVLAGRPRPWRASPRARGRGAAWRHRSRVASWPDGLRRPVAGGAGRAHVVEQHLRRFRRPPPPRARTPRSFLREGCRYPLTLRTYCSAAARISSSVAARRRCEGS